MAKLEGRVAIVTGGGGAIGAAAARLFIEEGARVLFVDRAEDALARAAKHMPAGHVASFAVDGGSGAR